MLESIKVKYKKLNEKAIEPTYQTHYAAGADLHACLDNDLIISPKETALIPTGISTEIPDGFVGLIYARSGLACKRGLAPANKVGVIDSDYRGEIIVALYNHSNGFRTITNGERIAQMIITPYYKAIYEEVSSLDDTNRGTNGFGSTGI